MFKTYKYRMYPTEDQKVLLDKHIGACRFLYNLALETKLAAYAGTHKNLTYFDLASQLKDLKKELSWLSDVNAQSLQMALRNLDGAFVKFYRGQSKFPKFKSNKRGNNSFQCPQYVKINFDGAISLPKFKLPIKTIIDRAFIGDIKTVTISRTPTLKYYASVLIDTKESVIEKLIIKPETSIGVDLGIKSLIVLSDGTKIDNPKYLASKINTLKYLQRSNKKIKGSNRYTKHTLKIAKLHEKIANQRKNLLHKLSDSITKNYDTICIENLKVSKMVKNRKLSSAISDCGWGMLVEFIKYKAEWRGKNILQIGTFDPSTKTCSCCGYINHNLTLSDREWTCHKCLSHHDRDINAAINIKNFGLKQAGVERTGVNVESPTLVGTMKR